MFVEIFANIQKALPVLAIIFVIVFVLILLSRAVLFFLLSQAHKRYLALKKTSKKLIFSNKKNFIKEDEELLRKKSQIPLAHSEIKAQILKNQKISGSYEILASKEQELEKEELSQVNIVDFVKPVGFWTSMILGQKLTYLIQSAQILNKRSDKGFWASMIEAKEREAGRQHSRGR
jgi:hypothetical protein